MDTDFQKDVDANFTNSNPADLTAQVPHQLLPEARPRNTCGLSPDGKFHQPALRLCINFSTYLPIRSASRLTASSTVRSRSAVTSNVCGMIQTRKVFLPAAATVRLMPSTAIEPLKTT